jgi:hypothetical protein
LHQTAVTVTRGDLVLVAQRGKMRWKRRDKKLRKRRRKIVKHGKAFGEMVRNAVRKRQGVSDPPPQEEEER